MDLGRIGGERIGAAQPAGRVGQKPRQGTNRTVGISDLSTQHPEGVKDRVDDGARSIVSAAHQLKGCMATQTWRCLGHGAGHGLRIRAWPQGHRIRRATRLMPLQRGLQRAQFHGQVESARGCRRQVRAKTHLAAEASGRNGHVGMPAEAAKGVGPALDPQGIGTEVDPHAERPEQGSDGVRDLRASQPKSLAQQTGRVVHQLIHCVAGHPAGGRDQAEGGEELAQLEGGRAGRVGSDSLNGSSQQDAGLGQHWHRIRPRAKHQSFPGLATNPGIVQGDRCLAMGNSIQRQQQVRHQHAQIQIRRGRQPAEPIAQAQLQAKLSAGVDPGCKVIGEQG